MRCTCDDRSHEFGTALWHRAYRRWWHHNRAGNTLRAAAWGRIADSLVNHA